MKARNKMGVYIKGMKMPKACWECPLMDGEYGDCKVGGVGMYEDYMQNCPLVEIAEPHGRLIDADSLMVYCSNQKSRTIDCNDIARFPTTVSRVMAESEE